MAETKTNFRDELTKLAEISEIFDNSVFNKGKVSVIVELNADEYVEIVNLFSPRDKNSERVIINISGIEFTLVSNK
tara:strand:+ start:2138 stop:2365 length:228 start_codon:yes stop_codon:yes gene_type:complete